MPLMYAKTMSARLRYITGKSVGEWGNVLASKKFRDREGVREFLLTEGLDSEFIGFIFWTSHSRINYEEHPVEEDQRSHANKKTPGTKNTSQEQGGIKEKSIVKTKISVEAKYELMENAKIAGDELQTIIEEVVNKYPGVTFSSSHVTGTQYLEWNADYEYNGDVLKLKDVFGITIVVPLSSIENFVNDFAGNSIVERIKIGRRETHPLGYSGTTVYVKLNGLIGKVLINTAEMIHMEAESRRAITLLGYDKYQAFEAKYNITGTTEGQARVYYEKYRWSCFELENKNPEDEIINTFEMKRHRAFLEKLRYAGSNNIYFINTLDQSVIKFNGKVYFVKFHGEQAFKAKKGSVVVVEGILEYQEITEREYENF
jgi:hypothetical protein